MLDQTDVKILTLLKENSRLQWREIGELVHLTGQAVANRIKKMEKEGIIEKYTINLNNTKLDKSLIAYITVFMKTSNHPAFIQFVKNNKFIIECHRISGDGCYLLKVNVTDEENLMCLLNKILDFGNYRLNISISRIK
ncbi:Lrp/AsnC family transcriptional regulator [Clostridium coskatii]|uniref:HTH-type transcriptional regulator LrpC n=1 Tax=Clostridium coskatii TaxID=1705578 RepID=A0A170NN04_9CLOT|nr:Lrp/AsnC family transcriptional regulator [Clostridium coskatii]OAA93240.1 HTH-type transcriptional regulator LrpC [Clostridium coskatii]OBR95377.1 HTH-type transcriptional regulator LrpC [Clostridium coskatii]